MRDRTTSALVGVTLVLLLSQRNHDDREITCGHRPGGTADVCGGTSVYWLTWMAPITEPRVAAFSLTGGSGVQVRDDHKRDSWTRSACTNHRKRPKGLPEGRQPTIMVDLTVAELGQHAYVQ